MRATRGFLLLWYERFLDRGYGNPAQELVLNSDDDNPIRLYVELPMKSKHRAWLDADIGMKVIEGKPVEVGLVRNRRHEQLPSVESGSATNRG